MLKIALLDYGMGNLRNVERAIIAAGATPVLVENGKDLYNFDAIILPGVGNFGDGMRHLRERGFEEPIQTMVANGTPLLGICLGMQMLFESSEEAPNVSGLGIFEGTVKRFPTDKLEKVPHMGWNKVSVRHECPMQFNFPNNTYFYFVHTFYVAPKDPNIVAATCNYIHPFTAAVGKDKIYATQFHPEKSQDAGIDLLRYFIQHI